jgi:hypothetical protein
MHPNAPAQAARRALFQRFLMLSGVLAVVVLLLAADSRSEAFALDLDAAEHARQQD